MGVLGLHLPDVPGDLMDFLHRAGVTGHRGGEVVVFHAAAGESLADDRLVVAVSQVGLLAGGVFLLDRDLDNVVGVQGLNQVDITGQVDDLLDRAGGHELGNTVAVGMQALQKLGVGLAEHRNHAVAEIPRVEVGQAKIAGGEVGLDITGVSELGVSDGLVVNHS